MNERSIRVNIFSTSIATRNGDIRKQTNVKILKIKKNPNVMWIL